MKAHALLLKTFDRALARNPFLMFELGYTRVTDWMVHIWDRKGGEPKKVIETQDPNREKCCRQAVRKLEKLYLTEK